MADSDLKKLLLMYPKICDYSLEKNIQPHFRFLQSLGISQRQLGKVSLLPPCLHFPKGFASSIQSSRHGARAALCNMVQPPPVLGRCFLVK